MAGRQENFSIAKFSRLPTKLIHFSAPSTLSCALDMVETQTLLSSGKKFCTVKSHSKCNGSNSASKLLVWVDRVIAGMEAKTNETKAEPKKRRRSEATVEKSFFLSLWQQVKAIKTLCSSVFIDILFILFMQKFHSLSVQSQKIKSEESLLCHIFFTEKFVVLSFTFLENFDGKSFFALWSS